MPLMSKDEDNCQTIKFLTFLESHDQAELNKDDDKDVDEDVEVEEDKNEDEYVEVQEEKDDN